MAEKKLLALEVKPGDHIPFLGEVVNVMDTRGKIALTFAGDRVHIFDENQLLLIKE